MSARQGAGGEPALVAELGPRPAAGSGGSHVPDGGARGCPQVLGYGFDVEGVVGDELVESAVEISDGAEVPWVGRSHAELTQVLHGCEVVAHWIVLPGRAPGRARVDACQHMVSGEDEPMAFHRVRQVARRVARCVHRADPPWPVLQQVTAVHEPDPTERRAPLGGAIPSTSLQLDDAFRGPEIRRPGHLARRLIARFWRGSADPATRQAKVRGMDGRPRVSGSSDKTGSASVVRVTVREGHALDLIGADGDPRQPLPEGGHGLWRPPSRVDEQGAPCLVEQRIDVHLADAVAMKWHVYPP